MDVEHKKVNMFIQKESMMLAYLFHFKGTNIFKDEGFIIGNMKLMLGMDE